MLPRGLLALTLLVITVACERVPPAASPNYSEPIVFAYLYRIEYIDRTVEYDRDVQVLDSRGLRRVPVVQINGEELKPYSYRPTEYRYGDGKPFPVVRRYDLNVSHFWGEAFSRVVMPGNFAISTPPRRFILARDSALRLAWQPSEGAQWYWVELFLDYEYNDSFGSWDDYQFSLDTLVTTTSLDIEPERMFPGFVAELLEGDGSVMVWAGSGPAVEPGDVGNVRGAGFGFFTAINEPAERYFYVGAPPASRRVPSPGKDRGVARLHRLAARAAAAHE